MDVMRNPPGIGAAEDQNFDVTERSAIRAAAPERGLSGIALIADRTLVLFVGLAVGAVIGGSFFGFRSGPAPAPQPVTTVQLPAQETPGAPRPPQAGVVAPEPAATPSPNLTRAVAEGRQLHVGVFGDSFGMGLWQGLYLQLKDDKSFIVHDFGKQATGFTRYAKLDLLKDITGKVDQQPVDIAVISFGANDAFDIYADGVAAKYMTPEWQAIVGRRVDAIIQLLRDRGAQIYWVGLPRMRDPEFDAKITQMNSFYRARMAALGVPFIDTVPFSVDAQGQYSPQLFDPATGKTEMARASDGIHMRTGQAYGILTRGLSGRIRDTVTAAKAEAEREATRRGAAG